jgi:hypothetical protein
MIIPTKLLLVCVLLTVVHVRIVDACYLWGTDSGECSAQPLDINWRYTYMPFCANITFYTACLPKYQHLQPSREFPKGRWFNHTVSKKDAWVQTSVQAHIRERMTLEQNRTLFDMKQNEFGEPRRIKRRFWKHPDCQNAFRQFFCWVNFPRCHIDRDLTMPTCRSVCENYFKACRHEHNLWRCGKTKFFNGLYFIDSLLLCV